MAEQRDLPGWPKKRLVRDVRRHLWRYGIRPKGEAWRAAWAWASAIANNKVIPDEVRRLLPSSPLPLLEDGNSKRKKAPAIEASTPPLIEGDAEC